MGSRKTILASVYNAVAGNETLGGVTYEDDGDRYAGLVRGRPPETPAPGVR